jgi:hypothetical protein
MCFFGNAGTCASGGNSSYTRLCPCASA